MSQDLVFAFFLVAGIAMMIGFSMAGRLYDYNLHLYRKWGWTEFAHSWEERKS